MQADNHGEGGIFSLYSLVKHCGKWLIILAMIGGAALLLFEYLKKIKKLQVVPYVFLLFFGGLEGAFIH